MKKAQDHYECDNCPEEETFSRGSFPHHWTTVELKVDGYQRNLLLCEKCYGILFAMLPAEGMVKKKGSLVPMIKAFFFSKEG
jgi:hypothetical protein